MRDLHGILLFGRADVQGQILRNELMSGETILLVDDDPGVLLQRSRYLRNHGYRVLTALDAASAEDAMVQRELRAVIVDLQLNPADQLDRSGLGLLRKVRKGVSRMVLTAHDDPETVRNSLVQEGLDPRPADEFVSKLQDEGMDVMLSRLQKMLLAEEARLGRKLLRYRAPVSVALFLLVAFLVQAAAANWWNSALVSALVVILVNFLVNRAADMAGTPH